MTQQGGVISYPIPAFQNLPIEAQFYQPSRFVITAISLGFITTVTTSVAHNYVISQQVRLIIPPAYGSRQLNESFGYVISIPSSTQVEIAINSVGVDAFKNPGTGTVAQILAIGDISEGAINASGPMSTGTYIPGSFINVS